jgi:hypothetical protein
LSKAICAFFSKTLQVRPFHLWYNEPLAEIIENVILRRMASCVVSYLDISGIRHTVEVEADRAFREHDCDPGAVRPIDVEIKKSITHTLTLSRVQQWLEGACRGPKEKVTKERLKALL